MNGAIFVKIRRSLSEFGLKTFLIVNVGRETTPKKLAKPGEAPAPPYFRRGKSNAANFVEIRQIFRLIGQFQLISKKKKNHFSKKKHVGYILKL